MPRISLPEGSGKSEKVVVSLSAGTYQDVKLYAEYTKVSNGGSPSAKVQPPKMAKLMIEKFLEEDKEFNLWKRKRPNQVSAAPSEHSEATQ